MLKEKEAKAKKDEIDTEYHSMREQLVKEEGQVNAEMSKRENVL